MDVTIVIPTLNGVGPDVLKPLGARPVVVVANGAGVPVDAPGATIVHNERNTGFARACNQGAAEATTPFVLFLNDDAVLETTELDKLLDAARTDTRAAAWQPLVVGPDGDVESAGELFTATGFARRLSEPASPAPYAVAAATGASLLVRRDAFERVGGFDDSYFAYSEDNDLCWRLRLAGWDVRVVPSASAIHRRSETTMRIFEPHEIRYLTYRNRWRTILANASASTLLATVPLHIAACMVVAAALLVSGRARSARSVLQALWWPVGNRDVLRNQRTRAQKLRTRPDREVMSAVRAQLSPAELPRLLREHLTRWER